MTEQQRAAMQAALDALEDLPNRRWADCWAAAREHLAKALAEPQPEPVFEVGFGWLCDPAMYGRGTKLYAAPPAQRQPLTDDQMPPMPSTHWVLHMRAEQYEQEWTSCEAGYTEADMREYARSIEAAHEIGGKP